jgi:phospholipase/carboxylesterase
VVHPPAAGGTPDSVVVLLHGLGANGADLIGLAPYWTERLPRTEFVAPDAPEPCDMAPFGFQWFSLQDRSPLAMMRGVATAAPLLDAFLDDVLAERGLDASRLALVGFSQGTMMSLHVGLRRAVAPAAIVGYSGMLVLEGDTDVEGYGRQVRARPPILLVHGDSDDLIPVQALMHAAQALAALEVPTEWHVSAGLGHGIDDEGLRQGGDFLARRFRAAR